MLVKDNKMEGLIKNLIPNKEEFQIFEQSEAKRYLKSAETKKHLREFKKLRAKQIAKEEKLKREKLMEKEKREKKRLKKAIVKQKEEEEKNERHQNRRRNQSIDGKYSNGL
jgi:Ulp1 family protease